MIKSITRKVMIIITIIIATLFIGRTQSKAQWLTFNNDLLGSYHLYCVQKDTKMTEGDYIRIKTITIDTAKADSVDRELAYILAAGSGRTGYSDSSGNYTSRQKQLWAYFNTWASKSSHMKNLRNWARNNNNDGHRIFY